MAGARLERLYAATAALSAELADEQRLLDRIVREAAALTHARYAAIGLLKIRDVAATAEGARLTHFVTCGLIPEEYAQLKDNPPHGRGILGALLSEGEPLRLADLGADPRSAGFPPGHPPMRSFLGVPLRLAGDVIGRLYMTESERGGFDEEDEQLALGFAAAASVAIGSARSTAALGIAASQLRSLLDALERGVCMSDANGVIVVANEPLPLLLGLEAIPVGMQERDFADRFASPETFLSALGLEAAQPRVSSTDHFELHDSGRMIRRYSAPIFAQSTALQTDATAGGGADGPIGPSGDVLLGRAAVYADATSDLEIQEQFAASERLRATGEMASGLAHDFNNLLATILGRVEVMLGETGDASQRENLLAVQRAARDGAATVARMREYGRPLDSGEFRPVALEHVVNQAVELTQPRWRDQAQREGRTIEVETRLRPTRPVFGDAASMREVLVNLIFNSVDAMPDGGRLTLALAPAGAGAELVVSDTGHGMSQAIQRRIFEPFFTTKGEKGSGLGLAMARKVVAALGGRIDVTSEPGRGTTCTVWLPTTDASVESLDATPADRPAGRIGRIVVVDDQQDVLDTTAMLLRSDGHDVRVFLEPRAAVASIVAEPPDLVITDLGMPGMNGWDVARSVHQAYPKLPVVLLTGWGREISAQQMRDGGIAALIPKPVEGPRLREAVAAVLPSEEPLLRVLLVDDSAAFAAVLAMLIEQSGHQVVRAATVQASLAELHNQAFDLLVVDAGLSDRPAVDLVAAGRLTASRPLICVVSGSAETAMRASLPDADLYVEKVQLPERLDEIVRAARERRREG